MDSETLVPFIGQLSLGSIMGFAAGYFVKKAGKTALFVVGGLFILLQGLAFAGFIHIDWLTIQQKAEPLFEKENVQHTKDTLVSLLTLNLPFTATFLTGFALGFKAG